MTAAGRALLESVAAAGAQGLILSRLGAEDRVGIEGLVRSGRLRIVERKIGRGVQKVARLVAEERPDPKPEKKPADPLERYYTPDVLALWVCATIARRHGSFDRILEPSAGGCAIARAIRTTWPSAHVLGIDLDPAAPLIDGLDAAHHGDFLAWSPDPGKAPQLVIGNPPFRTAPDHVRHALDIADSEVGVVAFLLPAPISHLPGWGSVRPPWNEFPLRGRPRFEGPALPNARGSARTEYSLFVWLTYEKTPYTLKYRAQEWRGRRAA